MNGDISYNGKGFDQFRAVHTASYVDQNDLHQPMLTVKETLDFASRVQGVGHKLGEHPSKLLCSITHTRLNSDENDAKGGKHMLFDQHC